MSADYLTLHLKKIKLCITNTLGIILLITLFSPDCLSFPLWDFHLALLSRSQIPETDLCSTMPLLLLKKEGHSNNIKWKGLVKPEVSEHCGSLKVEVWGIKMNLSYDWRFAQRAAAEYLVPLFFWRISYGKKIFLITLLVADSLVLDLSWCVAYIGTYGTAHASEFIIIFIG